ncbi:MAG TPA: beta-ketoacyl synthase N-terminal-like domain-containing protein [Gemmataceae bacterium]|nr:beta-ketoacyl synthase N-terminal-like domain-containing protein [Gemmataceae bacterium]
MTDRNVAKDIAIVGMACMFAGAKDIRRYWQNICNRLDAIQEVPAERWRLEDFYSEDRLARDRIYSRWGGFLESMIFDPVKWRIPPASLPHIEPVQLMSLEVAWQAMVDAGYDPLRGKSEIRNPKSENEPTSLGDFPRERAGVLFAVSGPHELGTAYCFRTMMRHYLPKVEGLTPQVREQIYAGVEEQLPEWTEDSFPGILGNVVAGRIAREFDFHGPNFTLDAACASSLAALFTAVQQLRSGVSDLMLVGSADGTNNPFGYMSFAKTHALSPRGKSRAFDDSGDGIALGEGIACIVLKRLEDAERDGNRIYAVVKGVGASSDGKNRSLTAPHPPGQMRAVQRAYEEAEFSPATVALIEAHGTGTVVGDSAELTTLSRVFDQHTNERQYVAVGSVKSMIGHTKTVAGLASIIKTSLALHNRVLPPTIGIDKPSTRIDLAQSPFYLNTETRPWIDEKGNHPRRAGVSSFGFGGTNFHVVLEEYRPLSAVRHPLSASGDWRIADGGQQIADWMPRAAEVFVLQRANREEMVRDLRQFQQHLDTVAVDDLAGLAGAVFAEESHRTESPRTCRLAIVAGSVEDLRKKIQKALVLLPKQAELNDPSGIYHSEMVPVQASAVCFLYPGQGSQSVNMLRDLAIGCPWSHDLFREANRLLADELPQVLTRYLYPLPAFQESERERQTADLQDTRIAQPALGLVELFATDLLERFGVRPAFVAGHSYGEHVALHVAGCLSRVDLLRLSAQRGRLCAEVSQSCPGAMASVQAEAATTETALRERNISARLANLNGPTQTVIAGPVAAIDAAIEQLSQRGLRIRKLPVSAAFHTPQLNAASEVMRTHLAAIAFERPWLPVYSNTTGQRHDDDPESIRSLLARHFAEPVLFEKEVRQLHADGARLFVEVGPGKVLTDLVSRILRPLTLPSPPGGGEGWGEGVTSLALDTPGRDGWTQLGHLLARLTVLGLPVQVDAWFAGRGLACGSVVEFIARTRTANTPKPSDWILLPNKAEPVTPLPDRNYARANHISRDMDRKDMNHTTSSTIHDPRIEAAMTTTNGQASVNGNGMVPAGSDLFAQFQATTRVLLEAQQAQNRVLERYLETQERLLLHCSQGSSTQPADAGRPRLPPSPVPDPVSPAGTPTDPPPRVRPAALVARPPVPISRNPIVTPSRLTVESRPAKSNPASALNGSPPAPAMQVVHASTPPAPTPNSSAVGDGPPLTEAFRQDLLEVVSVRTGYPIDALDETLGLEAELGIDSIKTVEIFSNLKAYHRYFRAEDQEEEELLAEFTKLKTLRDIIDSYDRRRQILLAEPRSNGAEPANDSVNRYIVTSVSVALGTNGEKKNASLKDTSSS